MAETLETILKRRSIRKYKPDPIPEEILDKILEAGMWAPTGKNDQSPIIICVTNKEARDRLMRINAAVMGHDVDPFYGAPVVCVVLVDKQAYTHAYDGELVIENMLLAATDLGLGSCYIFRAKEMFESEDGKAFLAELGIEGDYEGVGNVILGYIEGEPPAPKPRKENWVYRVD